MHREGQVDLIAIARRDIGFDLIKRFSISRLRDHGFSRIKAHARPPFDRRLFQNRGSVLWLLDAGPETSQRLRLLAAAAGIAPERICFAPKRPNPQHLARYALAELFLDTFPYGAHTTASDAMWMGTPVLTLEGQGFAARVCAGLVRNAGLPDLVCTNLDEYVARAIAIAAVPGVDALMMGPMDLSLELGIPGELRHPRILAAYDASLKAAMGAGKHFACGDAGGPPVAQLVAQGARILLGSNDANYLLQALTQAAQTLDREAQVSGS